MPSGDYLYKKQLLRASRETLFDMFHATAIVGSGHTLPQGPVKFWMLSARISRGSGTLRKRRDFQDWSRSLSRVTKPNTPRPDKSSARKHKEVESGIHPLSTLARGISGPALPQARPEANIANPSVTASPSRKP